MASVITSLEERRGEPRCAISETGWQASAVLRPGMAVILLNLSTRAALVESAAWLRPGARTELQVAVDGGRTSVRARLDRCYVAALEPLRYRGVLIFDVPLNAVPQSPGKNGVVVGVADGR